MKYRDFMSLTDEEITQIVTDIFHPVSIKKIERDEVYQFIYVTIESDIGDSIITETVDLTIPSSRRLGLSADFTINSEEYELYNKFLLAKGVNIYLKDNPYLEDEENIELLTDCWREIIYLRNHYKGSIDHLKNNSRLDERLAKVIKNVEI